MGIKSWGAENLKARRTRKSEVERENVSIVAAESFLIPKLARPTYIIGWIALLL